MGSGDGKSGGRVPTIFRRGAWTIAFRHPLRYLFIPLLLAPASEEANDDHGHVVTSHTTRLRVGSQAVVHHVLADLIQILLGDNTPPDEFDHGLR